jgi:hypothetical protein
MRIASDLSRRVLRLRNKTSEISLSSQGFDFDIAEVELDSVVAVTELNNRLVAPLIRSSPRAGSNPVPNKTVVLRYRIQLEAKHLAPATITLRLAAVRRLAYEAAEVGLLSPDLAGAIRRLERSMGVPASRTRFR